MYAAQGKGYEEFNTLVQSVRAVLQRQRTAGPNGALSTCFLDSERDDYEDDTKLYRKSFDVRVWYREA